MLGGRAAGNRTEAVEPVAPRSHSGELNAAIVRPDGAAAAHRDNIVQHPRPVAEHVDLAAIAVIPPHRYLAHAQAGAARFVEQLDVEAEAVDRAGLDERPADIEPECLEAALSVVERKSGGLPEHEIERPAGQLTSARLMNAYQATVEGARSDCDVHFAVGDRAISLSISAMGVDKSASEKSAIGVPAARNP